MKKMSWVVKTTLLLVTIVLIGSMGAFAATDGIYTLTEVFAAWDGTDASRTKAPVPAPVGSGYQYEYDYTYGDESSVTYTLPWSFNFYGQTYTQVTADTNGNVWFGATGSAHSFNLASNGRGPVIAAWNDDLSSYYYGGVFIQHKTDPEERVVVEWQTETYSEEGFYRPNTFEVVLYPNGDIRIDYKTFSSAYIQDAGSGISDNNSHHYLREPGTINSPAGRSFLFAINPPDETPIAGVCGTASGTILTAAPTTDLCATGTASSVTGAGPWSWTCAGLYGGASAECSANTNHTVTVTATPGGLVGTETQAVVTNATAAISVIPVPGYHPVVTGCNGSLSGNTYTTGPITADCTVAVAFAKSDVTFKEAAYLAANPDVAAAVKTGEFTSGWQHYELFGRTGGRRLAPEGYGSFNETTYLMANPDVAAVVTAGGFANGWQHYEIFGRAEGRPLEPAGYANFDEEEYLAASPDVATAVKAGTLTSGWQHYEIFGRTQGRPLALPSYGSFREREYLLANPDVAAAVQSGVFTSGWQHYDTLGRAEGRNTTPAGYVIFCEAAYLAANKDVAAAVTAGTLTSGWQHYDIFGRNEGRPVTPPGYANYNEEAYLVANPDIATAVTAGVVSSGWDHYDHYGRNEGRPLNPASYGAFSEADYLAANPDVLQAVLDGIFASGWQHYENLGKNEGRNLRP